MSTNEGDAPAPAADGPRNLHVVERGDSWEVWRRGDSMPLGTYVTSMEAEERAATQAAEEGVEVEDHDLDLPAGEGPDAGGGPDAGVRPDDVAGGGGR
jgi:hypothetical protein